MTNFEYWMLSNGITPHDLRKNTDGVYEDDKTYMMHVAFLIGGRRKAQRRVSVVITQSNPFTEKRKRKIDRRKIGI